MDAEQYLKDRVDDQIDWHDRKSQWNQRCFKRLQLAIIVSGALIPLISIVNTGLEYTQKIAVAVLGVAVAIATGILTLYRFQEVWIDYRLTAESLRSEKFRFQTKVAPYDGPNADSLLVHRAEAILSHQNVQWQQLQQGEQPPKDEQPGLPGEEGQEPSG
jgi:hypothetical protein